MNDEPKTEHLWKLSCPFNEGVPISFRKNPALFRFELSQQIRHEWSNAMRLTLTSILVWTIAEFNDMHPFNILNFVLEKYE